MTTHDERMVIKMALTAKVHKLGTNNAAGEPNKGTISVYGQGPRPWFTLYHNQLMEVAAVWPQIVKMAEAAYKAGEMAGPQDKAPSASKSGRVTLGATK